MNNEKREEGYYWVKYQGVWQVAEYVIGRYNTIYEDETYNRFILFDCPYVYDEDEFDEINEKQIELPVNSDKNKFEYWKIELERIKLVSPGEEVHMEADDIICEICLSNSISLDQKKQLVELYNSIDKWYA